MGMGASVRREPPGPPQDAIPSLLSRAEHDGTARPTSRKLDLQMNRARHIAAGPGRERSLP